MNKHHQSPEFTVIKQSQANAKFFVASMENNNPNPETGDPQSGNVASTYDYDQNNGLTM